MGQQHLFETQTQLKKLTNLQDPLIKANQLIDWEIFRQPIENAIHKNHTQGGRPPYDAILMYKTVTTTTMVRPIRHASPIPNKRPPLLHALFRP